MAGVLEQAIATVEVAIKKVETEINDVEKTIASIKGLPGDHPDRAELPTLWQKEVALRQEKAALRQEKVLLLSKEDVQLPGSGLFSDYVLKLGNLGSPSELDPKKEQQAQDQQGTPTPLIQNWRPPFVSAAVGMPPVLLHKVFGEFVDNCYGDRLTPTKDTLRFLIRLCKGCSSFYQRETNLEMAVHSLLQDYLAPLRIFKISPAANRRVQTDGAIVEDISSPDEADWMAVLLEVKEDMGKSGDANYQGAAYHGMFYSHRRNDAIFNHTVCPTLLLEVVGPHLRVSALTWASALSVVPLTPMMHTLLLMHDKRHMLALARLLEALRIAAFSLVSWYGTTKAQLLSAGVQVTGPRQAAVQQGFPYPLHENYRDIRPMVKDKHVYSAVPRLPSDGQQQAGQRQAVVVKFCSTYSAEVHHAWASLGLAPKLHTCQRLPGGWWWVQMELLDPADGWLLLSQVPDSQRPSACDEALSQLQQAHQALLPSPSKKKISGSSSSSGSSSGSGRGKGSKGRRSVHGDMRGDANVLYRSAPGSVHGWEVRFVDFERSGEEGVMTYPPFMNSGVDWPAGVEYGKPLRQVHDVQLLRSTCRNVAPGWGQSAEAAAAEVPVPKAATLVVPHERNQGSKARRSTVRVYKQLLPSHHSPLLLRRPFMHNARRVSSPQFARSLRSL